VHDSKHTARSLARQTLRLLNKNWQHNELIFRATRRTKVRKQCDGIVLKNDSGGRCCVALLARQCGSEDVIE
jgi:hypothetical protein